MNPALTLRILAILVAIRALTNFFKASGGRNGFILFGFRLDPTMSMIVGPAFGLLMLAYVWAVWTHRRIAIPLGVAYAIYATVNIILFPIVSGIGQTPAIAYFAFSIVGIAVSWGMVWLLRSMEAELR